MLYSVKMRSSLGGTHGKGGRHISGAERIVSEDLVDETVISMMRRAREHERGCADFIQVKVEEVPDAAVSYCLMLPLYQIDTSEKSEGHRAAEAELIRAGVSPLAARRGIASLEALEDSMRGAIVMDAETGERLDAAESAGSAAAIWTALTRLSMKQRCAARVLAAIIRVKRLSWHRRWLTDPAR